MTDSQSLWHVDSARALTLAPSGKARRLAVEQGRVWLTVSGTADEPARDQWLEAGEVLTLEPRQTAVVEGWPAADFTLLTPPQASAKASARRPGLLGRRFAGGFGHALFA